MRGRQTLHVLTDRGLLRALRGDEGGVGGHVFESPSLLSHGNSCALLPRVLESLLVSLVTTVVVFVASMVLGECRQISSSSQVGNDSFLLQVSPEHLLHPVCDSLSPGAFLMLTILWSSLGHPHHCGFSQSTEIHC